MAKVGTTQRADEEVAAIILAAGKSTRMRSRTPKALHPVCGKPILFHLLDALDEIGVRRRVVVVGHGADSVRNTVDAHYGVGAIEYAVQAEQRGTGHAVQMAEAALGSHRGPVTVLPGDAPLLTGAALRELIDRHTGSGAAATLLTAVLPGDAGSYGRVVRGPDGQVLAIVEARDATAEQRDIREINTSVYAFDGPGLFRALRDLRPDNAQGELYLTDAIQILGAAGQRVGAVVAADPDIVLGVNTRVELADIAARMRARLLRDLMLSGVTIADPATTYVDAGVLVGQDTVLLPNTHLLGGTCIGEDCVIGPDSVITNTRVGDRVRVRASFVEGATIDADSRIGPFANIRPGTVLGRGVKVGNFVEVKASTLEDDVSAGHLTYLGDATVGARTNVGAGTITANFDYYTKRKFRTQIGADISVGSHTTFVAPVVVGDGSATAAGSVVTGDVPASSLAIARERQTVREGWAQARRASARSEREVAARGSSDGAAKKAEKSEGTDR
jgi:bifunctional UDP-N-acetylglucosamine pyrophosphorylase/glucosamine-1-phosphate N-acetyltransferase